MPKAERNIVQEILEPARVSSKRHQFDQIQGIESALPPHNPMDAAIYGHYLVEMGRTFEVRWAYYHEPLHNI